MGGAHVAGEEGRSAVGALPAGGGQQTLDVYFKMPATPGSRCLLVNARNRNELDPEAACREWIARIEVGRVGEIHVAGHARVDGLCIDDHGSAVEDTTWRLFHFARERFAGAPGLLEWDTDIPSLDRLLAEVAKASTPGSRA